MERLWRSPELRELDRRTIADVGVPGIALMERAGAEAARLIRERFPQVRRPWILAGGGNNGGDGYVIARHLLDAGLAPTILAVRPPATPEAQTMARAATHLEIPLADDGSGCDLIVDAILGSGLRGAPEPAVAQVIDGAAERGLPIVSIDVPSGVAPTGEVPGAAIRATLTIALQGRSLGTAIEPGRGCSGEIAIVPIGLSRRHEGAATAWRMERADLAGVPVRRAVGTKYDAGSVLVVGGAPGMSGAPVLATRSAFRAGAGLVWTCVPAEVVELAASHTPEAMVCAFDRLDELAERASAIVCGPGLGRGPGVAQLVARLVADARVPLVLDADALFALAGRLEVLADRAHPTVLTPHAGELARLLGRERREVESGRLTHLEAAVEATGACVLLKGPDTLVAAKGAPLRVVETSVAQLATAGAGDVLSGVVGGLLARGLGPLEAASLGALAHGLAAEQAHGLQGNLLAGDLMDPLGRLLA